MPRAVRSAVGSIEGPPLEDRETLWTRSEAGCSPSQPYQHYVLAPPDTSGGCKAGRPAVRCLVSP